MEESNYDKARYIATAKPQLMFQHVNFMHMNGQGEIISPLKCAFKLIDTYMWKTIFFEIIKNDANLVALFQQQAIEQKEHISKESISKAYSKLIDLPHYQFRADMNYKPIHEAWHELTKAQNLLPPHMLKELCREGNSWNSQSTFSIDELPPPLKSKIYFGTNSTSYNTTIPIFDSYWVELKGIY